MLPGADMESEIGYVVVKNSAFQSQSSRDSGQRLPLAMKNVYFYGISLRPKNSCMLPGRET